MRPFHLHGYRSTQLFLLCLLSSAGVLEAQSNSPGDPDAAVGMIAEAPQHIRSDFEKGIVALHDFWFEEAEERFRSVQHGAPDFVLGYWGEAMALHRDAFGHTPPPVDDMRAVLDKLAPTPEARAAKATDDRERSFLSALELLIDSLDTPAERHPAYAERMGQIAVAHPNDIEAQAFYARAILLEAPSFGHSPQTQEKVAREAEKVLARDPNHHGGLHYFIHGMDSPTRAAHAVSAADRYQDIAEGASHAVHMPSHIYLQTGSWDRVVAGNQAAIRTSEQWIRRTGRTLDSLDRHAVDFLLYALLQQGRDAEARALLQRTRREREEFNSGALRWYDALWTARYAMALGTRNDMPLYRSGYRSVGEALGLGLFARAVGDSALLANVQDEINTQTINDGGPEWRIAALELEAAISAPGVAVSLLKEAIVLQSELPRPNETPDLGKPPEELLGEVLLEAGDPLAARTAFRAGEARWPSRLATRLGLARAAIALEDELAAVAEYRALLEQLRHADPDHPAKREARQFLASTGGHTAAPSGRR